MKFCLLKSTLCASFLLLSACSSIPSTPDGFNKTLVETERMTFLTWEKETAKPEETLRFYIEGNGTPNPKKAIALSLAQEDDTKNVIVLSRICQYINNPVCKNKDIWGKEQYHPEILNEMSEILSFYIKKYRPKNIEFVAYADATPIAFYLAQKFGHTKQIITIAGVLDIPTYARHNKLPKFKNVSSVEVSKHFISTIPQIHYVGSDDNVVTRSMTERFVSNLHNPKNITVKVVHGFDHDDWDNIKLSY